MAKKPDYTNPDALLTDAARAQFVNQSPVKPANVVSEREKLEKYNFNMLPSRVALIDQARTKTGLTRTAYISQAIAEKLERDGFL
jgi:hypothetical protein